MDSWYSDWHEWEGTGFPRDFQESAIYYSLGEVDMDSNFALRTLARTMKDDGVVDSVADGLELLEDAVITHGTLIEVGGERVPFYGDEDDIEGADTYAATWVEVKVDG